MSSSPTFAPDAAGAAFSRAWKASHRDFFEGVASVRLWFRLGLQDVRIRYKRTFLGPLWITASMAATFIAMGMLYSAVFKQDVRLYLPYLAVGMVTWTFLANIAADGPQVFVDSQHIINSLKIPFPVHALRCATRNAIIFGHNLLAALATHLILGGEVGWSLLLLPLTVPLLLATAGSLALILGIMGARFRDLGPIIGMIVQLGFFMTPILWRTSDLTEASLWWVRINPAYHLIEVVRAPMLGGFPDWTSLAAAGATALLATLGAYVMLCLFRNRISYWL